MQLRVFQEGFNYAQDGPGNRLVYHLQGCNLRCPWCANPEGLDPAGTLLVQAEWLTEAVCPHHAIREHRLDRSRCASCTPRPCLHERRNQGIRCSARVLTVAALVDQARRSAPLMFDGGGVTLSGGEPTLQFRAVAQLLGQLKAEGFHTALETNGTHPRLPELFPLVDALILDVKHHDDAVLRRVTGVGDAVLRRNLARACAGHGDLRVRIPVVHGFNDAPGDAERFADAFAALPTDRATFECLPFHEYGKIKWAQCGLPYRMGDGALAAGTLEHFQAVFRARNLRVVET